MSLFCIQIFVMGSERQACNVIFNVIECIMTDQGHPRSLIFTPIESSLSTSYYWSIVTLVVSCTVVEILTLEARNSLVLPTTPSFEAPTQGEPLRISGWNLPPEKPEDGATVWWKLRDPNFNRFWLIHPCVGRTDGQTDRRNCHGIKPTRYSIYAVARKNEVILQSLLVYLVHAIKSSNIIPVTVHRRRATFLKHYVNYFVHLVLTWRAFGPTTIQQQCLRLVSQHCFILRNENKKVTECLSVKT